jgi:hypothetical protein
MVKKSGLVDKLVAKKKKKRELCLDLNSGSGMFVNKNEPIKNIVDDVLKVNKVESKKKILKPLLINEKAFNMFNLDDTISTNNLSFNNDIKPVKSNTIESNVIKSNAIESSAIESNAIESNAIESNAIESNAIESNAIESNAIESNAIKSNVVKSNAIESNVVKPIINKKEGKTKNVSKYSTTNIINLSRERYNKLIDKENTLLNKINFENTKIEKMKKQTTELDYIKKCDEEKKKLCELEKKLKKIELIKFLHQKKLSIEKYKQNIEQYNRLINNQQQKLLEYNKYLLNKKDEFKNTNNELTNNIGYKYKKEKEYNIDIINKFTMERNILYKKIIDKYKNNLICIKNIENNKYNLSTNYYLNNIDFLIKILNINDKYWNTIYDTSNFNFTITIK